MLNKEKRGRYLVLVVLAVTLIIVYVARLANLQIVRGDEIEGVASATRERKVAVEAPRGEILDRYGRPLVTNRMVYIARLDRVLLPAAEQNDIIKQMLDILYAESYLYEDKLPISSYPYDFIENSENTAHMRTSVASFLKWLELPEDADAADAMEKLVARYKLEAYPDSVARTLAGIRYDMERAEFSVNNPYFTVMEELTPKAVTLLKERGMDMPGVEVIVGSVREYVTPGLASHILGRVGPIPAEELSAYIEAGYKMNDTVGLDGIENSMEEFLRGVDGERVISQNNWGRELSAVTTVEPQPGSNVILTMDKRLQEITQESLAYHINRIAEENSVSMTDGWDADSGAVVVMEAKTGDILAMASHPTFDLTTFMEDYSAMMEDELRPMFNRAIAGGYEPGSTFKMATAVAGLNSGAITTSTQVYDRGVYDYYADVGYAPQCWIYTDYGYGHGTLNVTQAIQKSCNYFFYDTGRLTGIDVLNSFCRSLGLGVKTGVELPGESPGVLAGPEYRERRGERWYDGDTIQAAIGQSDNLFTPLQLATYVSTIVNGGTRYQAHIVDSIRTFHNLEVVDDVPPVVMDTVDMSEEYYTAIMEGMRKVTEEGGTARVVFQDYPIAVGGKTGTASVPTGSANGVFVAFAPYDDPEIVVAIVVEHGAHGNYVGHIARDVFDAYFDKDDPMTPVAPEKELLD